MSEFIKSYGVLILAIYGIIQYWFGVLWRKFFRKGKIEIYETGNIEIGYGAFGPTIGLNGTIRTGNKDVFVKSMDLKVIRESDKSQHIFNWIAFRPPKIDLTGSQPISMEIPCGFLVSPTSPYRFNIVFNDSDLFKNIRDMFNNYLSEWRKIIEKLTKIFPLKPDMTPPIEKIEEQKKLINEEFRKSPIRTDTFSALDRKCYWEPGDYSLTLHVITSAPDTVFTKNYRFSINESDSKNFKLNVITMLEAPISAYLRIPSYPYNFAYSEYK